MLNDLTINAMMDAIVYNQASLHSTYSTDGSGEISGGTPAYARKPITMAAAAGGVRTSSSSPTFDVPAGATVAWIGLWTSGGAFRGLFPNGGDQRKFQIDLTGDRILCRSHGLIDSDRAVFQGGAPAPAVDGTMYFVVNGAVGDPDSLQLSLTQGGAPINFTGAPAGRCRISKIVPETFVGQQGTYQITNLSVGIAD